MIRWIEDKVNNRVFKEDIRVTRNGNVFSVRLFIGPYWGLSISGPETAGVNSEVEFTISIINWKGEPEPYTEPINATVTVYRDGVIEKELTVNLQDNTTFTLLMENTGNYTIIAVYQDWQEGAWFITIN